MHLSSADDSLLAIVPLKSLIKLAGDSSLIWRCDLVAHHEIVEDDGSYVVLSDIPRTVSHPTLGSVVVIDNGLNFISQAGQLSATTSLYEVLRRKAETRQLLEDAVARHHRLSDPAHTQAIMLDRRAGRLDDTECSTALRGLQDSPCDVLHANGIAVVPREHVAKFSGSRYLISFRSLDTIVGVDDQFHPVWWWGHGAVSGQHQPSVTHDGELLLLDNGVRSGRSRVVTVDPARRQITWSFGEKTDQRFFCRLAGGVEQVSDGRFLLALSKPAEAVEIDREGDVHWRWKLDPERFNAREPSWYRFADVTGRNGRRDP